MQTTLRIKDEIFRAAKAEAARLGITLTRFIEEALKDRLSRSHEAEGLPVDEVAQRNQIMEELLLATAHFRIGERPSREELNER